MGRCIAGNPLPTADTVETTIAITLTTQIILMGFAEGYRGNSEDPTYPGGKFNPLGLAGKCEVSLSMHLGLCALLATASGAKALPITGHRMILC